MFGLMEEKIWRIKGEMIESKDARNLSKQEALSIFCFLELEYSRVLEEKLDIVKRKPALIMY